MDKKNHPPSVPDRDMRDADKGMQMLIAAAPFVADIIYDWQASNPEAAKSEEFHKAKTRFLVKYYKLSAPKSGLSWRVGKPLIAESALALALFADSLEQAELAPCRETYQNHVPAWIKKKLREIGVEVGFLEGGAAWRVMERYPENHLQ